MASKREYLVLPKGTAIWPKLDEVDVYQPKKKDGTPKGPQVRKFVTGVAYDEAGMEKVKKDLKAAAKKLGVTGDVKLPIKKDKEGNEYLEAKRAEKLGPPLMFDAKNKKVPTLAIGGGSILRLKVAVNTYENDDEEDCMNLYIDQVQVIKLEEKGSSKSAFEADDEGFEYDAAAETETKDHNADNGEGSFDF